MSNWLRYGIAFIVGVFIFKVFSYYGLNWVGTLLFAQGVMYLIIRIGADD